jgi:uncharacterized membrane protein YhaH (DUF805 family)
MKANQLVIRIFDAALLACLVFGASDVRTFAFWLISIMVALMFLGIFGMDAKIAEKIQGLSIAKKVIGISIHCMYVAALIYAGFPILAALYAMVAMVIRVSAAEKLKEAQ